METERLLAFSDGVIAMKHGIVLRCVAVCSL